ncbi:MAG: hypothetical protein JNK87_15195 [Bryobacterales bacterium]|nr:hypothetical protein [Bryobacterales bacterium]
MTRAALLLSLAVSLSAQRPEWRMENPKVELAVDKGGGSIVTFQFKDQKLNPLKWANQGPVNENRAMAHFVCLDRWGQPSEAELKNGMPFHGEATRVMWQGEAGGTKGRMTASLPMAGLDIVRTIEVHPSGAGFQVTEAVTNRNKLGRPYNMVQHPTIGAPFLDESVVVDANARRGFAQSSPLPNPEEPSFYWPQALKDGQPISLRHLTNDPDPNVVSFVVEDEMGWVTAANAAKGLLLGYAWRTSEYPWLNIWRHVTPDGKPMARGLEFGTTGLHQPFGVLLKKGRIFGRPLTAWIEPGETQTRTYVAFLLKIPADFQGVQQVTRQGNQFTVKERNTNREFRVE